MATQDRLERIKQIRQQGTSTNDTTSRLDRIKNIRNQSTPVIQNNQSGNNEIIKQSQPLPFTDSSGALDPFALTKSINNAYKTASTPEVTAFIPPKLNVDALSNTEREIEKRKAEEELRRNYLPQLGKNIASGVATGVTNAYDFANNFVKQFAHNQKVQTTALAGALNNTLTNNDYNTIEKLEELEQKRKEQIEEDRAKTQFAKDYSAEVQAGNQQYSGLANKVLNAVNTVSNMVSTSPAGTYGLFANVAGDAYNEALAQGATQDEAIQYAIFSGGAETAIETLSGGASQKLLNTPAFAKVNRFTRNIKNPVARTVVNVAGDVLGEGVEEGITAFLDPYIQKITYNPNAGFNSVSEAVGAMGDAFVESILPTLIMGGTGNAIDGVNTLVNKQITAINSSNLSQSEKNTLINDVQKQADTILQNAQQNVTPQSPQIEQIQPSNEVIPTQVQNQNTADIVQNNVNSQNEDRRPTLDLRKIAQSYIEEANISEKDKQILRETIDSATEQEIDGDLLHGLRNTIKEQEQKNALYGTNTEQISQNNVENAQNFEKTVQKNKEQKNIIPYTQKDIELFTKSPKNIINGINGTFKDLANRIYDVKTKKGKVIEPKRIYFGRINNLVAKDINELVNNSGRFEKKIDSTGTNITLSSDNIKHIYDDHGNEKMPGQMDVTPENLQAYDVTVAEPDYIGLSDNKDKKVSPVIIMAKKINGYSVAVEVLGISSKNLSPKAYYIFKSDAPEWNTYIKNHKLKKALTAESNGLKPSENNALGDTAAASINNIIQSNENYVNTLPTQAEQEAKRTNLKKPKLEELAELTEEQAQLPGGSYKQKADKNTPYRRKFWDNVESSKIVSQEVKDQVNMTNYERKHNEETLEKMKDRLDTDPVKLTQEWWAKDIKKATDQDIALGAILLERYQAEGRFEEAVNVVEKLADIGTEAGRTVQMYSIFQRLTPEGMQIYQQRKLNSALETLTKKQTGKWVEQNKDKFKLTEDDATFITAKVQEAQNAPTERQKQIALAEIEKHINDKLPPEAGQSVKAFRRIAMLFNPKTQVRNVVGNTTVMPLNYVTDLVSTAIDKAIARKTGVRTTTLPSLKTIASGAKKGWNETLDDYRKGIRTTPTGTKYEIQNNVKNFNENINSKVINAINRKLNNIDRLLSSVMEAGDRPFYEAAYQNSLQGQMKANGVTTPTQDMIDIASNVALSQTWQDNNNYTQAVLGIRSAFNKININGFGLGDLIIPFAKTPANLTKAMVEYSPAGVIPTIINYNDMRKAISRGDMIPMQQKRFVTSVGKTVAGTMLYMLANSLVKGGAITGSSDEDKDVANFEKNVLGIQPYSIKIGDKTYTYNWAQPLAAPLAIMADAHKMSEEGAEWNEILLNAFKVGGDQLVANSFLQGIQELLSSEYGNESAMDNLVGAIMDLPTQFTPTLFGQIATQFDSTKRQTYENGDTFGTMVNELKNKIPGAKNTLAPQVNTFGEEIQNYGGANNPFNVFLNPGNISSANATDTQKELYALYEVTQDTTIFPRQAPYSVNGGGEKVTLSSQDRADYQKISGNYVTEQLDALFDSKFYKTLENEQKVQLVNKIVSDADTTAKDKWIDTKTTAELAETKQKLEDAGIPLIDYYNSWLAQKDIEGIPGPNGKTLSGSKSRLKKEEIDKVTEDLNKYQRRVLYEMFNVGESVW